MLIDWFTVVAQIINFLILVVLLKYLLYDRIIQAMEKREKNIRNRLEAADQKRKEAAKEAESYRKKEAEIESERRQILSKTTEEAEERRRKLAERARKEVDELQAKWRAEIQKEKEAFVQDFHRMTAKEVFNIAREAFRSLADADVEEKVGNVFLRRMQEMKKQDLDEIAASVQNANRRIVMRSGFDLSDEMREKVRRTMDQQIMEGIHIEYQTTPELLLGIELQSGDRKLTWSLEEYLANLEEKAVRLLDSVGSDRRGGE